MAARYSATMRLSPPVGCAALRTAAAIVMAASTLPFISCSEDPARSRDILFVSHRRGEHENIYALRLADLTTRRLVEGDSASSRSLPAWSPDGRSIAFIREFDDHDEFYVLDSLGGTPRRLAAELDAVAFPDWSPDGRFLLFSGGRKNDRLSVYLIRADGSGIRSVLSDSLEYRCPSWAPDQQRFTVAGYGPKRSSILVVDLASRVARIVLAADTAFLDCPQWSPKADVILFTGFPGNPNLRARGVRDATGNLELLDLPTGNVKVITAGPDLSNYGHWSRDARWIVFQSDRHAPPFRDSVATHFRFDSLEIYIVRPDGSGIRRLTTNAYYDAHPSW